MLKVELDAQKIELTKKNAKAEELIKVVQKETEKVKFEKDKGIYLQRCKIILSGTRTQIQRVIFLQPPKKRKK